MAVPAQPLISAAGESHARNDSYGFHSYFSIKCCRSNPPLHFNHLGSMMSNVSGSRKRTRNQEPPPVQFPARLTESAGASTSCLSPEVYAYLYQHNLEIDSIIRFHNERMRLEAEESRKKYCRYMISAMEKGITNRVREKEMELEVLNQKNSQLEEMIRQLSADNEIWFSIAKNSEAMVSSLQSSLQQALLCNAGSVDAVNPDAEDVQSCCIEGAVGRRICKGCGEKDVSVVLLPCKHMCICEECVSRVDTCPICYGVKEACVQANLQ